MAAAELAMVNCWQNGGIAHAIVEDVSLGLNIHPLMYVSVGPS